MSDSPIAWRGEERAPGLLQPHEDKPWIIISEREARALLSRLNADSYVPDDLGRAMTMLDNQLGWLKDRRRQTVVQRNRLISDAITRDDG